MEALVAASVAALTIYDMCKALERGMEITEVYVVRKSGGRSGVYERAGKRGARDDGEETSKCWWWTTTRWSSILLMKGLAPHCDAAPPPTAPTHCCRSWTIRRIWWCAITACRASTAGSCMKNCARRQQTKQLPFIFLASRGDIEEKLRPMLEGVEEFITKPFFLKDLVRRHEKGDRPPAARKAAEARGAAGRDSGPARGDEHSRPDAVARNGPEVVPVDDSSRR